MKMKKLILIAAMILATVGALSAQGRIAFRADAAVGFSAGDYKVESVADFATKSIVGYRFSGGIEAPIGYGLYVNPGIAFHSKGMKTNFGEVGSAALGLSSLKAQMHYIEIPVHLGYRLSLLNLVSVAVQAGPYLSYAIKGDGTAIRKDGQETTFDIYKEGLNEMMKAKRFDVGLGAAAMVGYSNFYLLIGADFGLINTVKDIKPKAENLEATLKNTSFHVGLGVRL
ncbi:membrane protein [Porphyromonas gulae]|uniref:Membrane protein n=2 Tax=Porphyromonas gulae TaxID=111105 RepID=A0A099WZC2_9PORP|nr:membrane protein [Porphyromonas gulae]KGN70778.1 membrane protein [Porphyromonas gulae]KGN75702.1 membrane protein [Porphyromonas gulae]KGN76800.1 membrane protein [Porphyromonas gulae]KGN83405.1 membrane protein [Porphyromonas gulae]